MSKLPLPSPIPCHHLASYLSLSSVIPLLLSTKPRSRWPLLFRTLVHPHLEYANMVSGPFNREDQKRVERVQRRATNLVASIRDHSYKERLQALKLQSLYHHRRHGDIFVYQVLWQEPDMDAQSSSPHHRLAGHTVTNRSCRSPKTSHESDGTHSVCEWSTSGTRCHHRLLQLPAQSPLK